MAENFFRLSPTFMEGFSNPKHVGMLRRMEVIVTLLDDNYNLTMKHKEVMDILESQNLKTLGASFLRCVYLITDLAEYFKSERSERKEILRRVEEKVSLGKAQREKIFQLSLGYFKKDGIRSWSKIEKLLRTEISPEGNGERSKIIIEGGEVCSVEPGFKQIEKGEDFRDNIEDQIFEAMRMLREGTNAFSDIIRNCLESVIELRGEFSECSKELEIRRGQLERANEQISLVLREKEEAERKLSLSESNFQEISKKFEGRDVMVADLSKEIGAMKLIINDQEKQLARTKIELEQAKSQTPESLVKELKEALSMAKNTQGPVCEKVVPGKTNINLQTFSSHFGKDIEYSKQATSYFSSLNRKGQRVIKSKIDRLAEMGCRYNSLDPKIIEGGEFGGMSQIDAGRYRVFWEERPACIYVHEISRKGENKHVKQ